MVLSFSALKIEVIIFQLQTHPCVLTYNCLAQSPLGEEPGGSQAPGLTDDQVEKWPPKHFFFDVSTTGKSGPSEISLWAMLFAPFPSTVTIF